MIDILNLIPIFTVLVNHFLLLLIKTRSLLLLQTFVPSVNTGGKTSVRTSDGGNRSHNVSLPIILKKTKVGQILQYSCIKFTVSPYFLILDSGFCFIKCTALFWGRNGHFLY